LVEEFEKIEYLINSLAIQTNVKAVKLLMKHSVSKSISEFKSLLSTITPTTETASEVGVKWLDIESKINRTILDIAATKRKGHDAMVYSENVLIELYELKEMINNIYAPPTQDNSEVYGE